MATLAASPVRAVVGRSRRWWAVAALLVVFSLAVRVAWVAHSPHYLSHTKSSDSVGYLYIARSVAFGHGWPRTAYHRQPSAFRAPLYPLFLVPLYRIAAEAQIQPPRTLVR